MSTKGPRDQTSTQPEASQESSGVKIEYDGEYKAITDVIRVYQLNGDEVRAKLAKAIKEAVKAAKDAKHAASVYAHKTALQAQQQG